MPARYVRLSFKEDSRAMLQRWKDSLERGEEVWARHRRGQNGKVRWVRVLWVWFFPEDDLGMVAKVEFDAGHNGRGWVRNNPDGDGMNER